MPSPTPASEYVPTTSLALVPLPRTIFDVYSFGVAPSSTWNAIQISLILSTLVSHLPSAVEVTSTSVVPSSAQVTFSKPSKGNTKIDALSKELIYYATKDFFSFMKHCMTTIMKG